MSEGCNILGMSAEHAALHTLDEQCAVIMQTLCLIIKPAYDSDLREEMIAIKDSVVALMAKVRAKHVQFECNG